jgi:hypothetical protein
MKEEAKWDLLDRIQGNTGRWEKQPVPDCSRLLSLFRDASVYLGGDLKDAFVVDPSALPESTHAFITGDHVCRGDEEARSWCDNCISRPFHALSWFVFFLNTFLVRFVVP